MHININKHMPLLLVVVLLVVALLISPGSSIDLTNDRIKVTFLSTGVLSTVTAPTESGSVAYNIEGDSWSAQVAPVAGAPSSTLGPAQCPMSSVTSDDTHVFVTYGGGKCGPYRVVVSYELQQGWAFVTKTLMVQSEHEDTSFFVTEIDPFGYLRVSAAAPLKMDKPFVVANPFDNAKQIGLFQRFPSIAASVFVTVQNPFTTHTAITNTVTACTPSTDHPYGDEPAMPLMLPTTDPLDCALRCSADSACKAYAVISDGCRGVSGPLCYLKSTVMSTTSAPDCLCSGTRGAPTNQTAMHVSYAPNMAWNAFPRRSPGHISDPAVFGVANVSKYTVMGGGLTTAERDAYAACVEEFLMDKDVRANHTVKINVAWDENDYQIDVSTAPGVTQYRRIIDRASQLGITHIVFEPQDSLRSSHLNASDMWGWESGLWMTMGEQVRTGAWIPGGSIPFPTELQQLVDYASARNVRLCAYVYPVLAFSASSEWLFEKDGRVWASLAVPEFQEWLSDTLITFVKQTGRGGFAWDYTFFNDPRPGNEYSQWRGWMTVISAIRDAIPEVVMDHRQLNHVYGPWYQLAGSYAEPIAGDENPETYGVGMPTLHTDHVAANNMRAINYIYRDGQLQPQVRVPGFAFHQTERSDSKGQLSWTDLYIRDFDFMGFQYSLLSSIGTAGLNNVFAMIPARDLGEFQLLPQKVLQFISGWLSWTDDNIDLLTNTVPISTATPPAIGSVDGTSAFTSDASHGVMFLFNPSPLPTDITVTMDESVGLSNSTQSYAWKINELYPTNGAGVGTVTRGQKIIFSVPGASARVLNFTRITSRPPMMITNALGNVAYDRMQRVLTLSNVTGIAGASPAVSVRFVVEAPHKVIVNGKPVARFEAVESLFGFEVDFYLSFGGGAFSPMQQIGDPTAARIFSGPGTYQANITVPTRIAQQLTARQASFPINWTSDEYSISWLVPSRLMLNIAFQHPTPSWDISLTVDGHNVNVQRAYTSRLRAVSNCFMGYFADLQDVVSINKQQSVVLTIRSPVAKGSFLGLFVENIDYEYTQELQ